MGQTLYEKVFDRHVVREITPGQYQLLASPPPAQRGLQSARRSRRCASAVSSCGIPG